jgi:predicted permease
MFRNYFITALRSFWRNKAFTLINISGLAIGISSALVIYMIVQHEFSYEKFIKDGDRIYRVVSNMHFPDQDFKNGGVPGPLPKAVKQEIAAIEASTHFWMPGDMEVNVPADEKQNKIFKKQEHIIYTSDDYFSFVRYEWIAGSGINALKDTNSVVLTESLAKTYFPSQSFDAIIGKTIIYNDSTNVQVTGIVKNLDAITEFNFEAFISLPTYIASLEAINGYNEWGSVSSSSQFLVKLKKGTDVNAINKQIKNIRNKHKKDAYLETDHFLQPLSGIHFNTDFNSINLQQAHKPTLYGLLAVAAFLLLLGCINFINLTTAHASQRAKEIGIRKTMGSSRKSIIAQFLGETFLLTLSASLLSIFLAPFILKIFSDFIPANLNVQVFQQPDLLLFILALSVVVSLFAGFYPAVVLSKYKPVAVLKNIRTIDSNTSRRVWVRKSLTVSQFVIAQFFIIASLVVAKQIRYSIDKDMGFRKEAILTFTTPYNFQQPDGKQFVLEEKLLAVPGIEKLSLSGGAPASTSISSTTMKFVNNGKELETTVEIKAADDKYFDLFEMKLIAGRNLQLSDTAKEYVVNEKLARFFGFKNPANIVGHVLNRGDKKIPVVGVLADFNAKSLHSAIAPLAYESSRNNHHNFYVALPIKSVKNWQPTIKKIERTFREFYPETDFNYTFFDERIAAFYKNEQNISRLLQWSTGLTIFISCLGLLGLVIFTTSQRVKEIGVRKVLGASVTQIVALLSKDFILLVFLAFLIAAPIAWWAMHKWLEDFVYRTSISWWIFIACGFGMLLIALVTLGYQTIRTAIANPVKSLRTE